MNFKITLKDLSTTGPLKKLMAYMKEGKEYYLEIKAVKEQRSLSQNQYYWAVVVAMFSEQTGYTKQEAHQQLSWNFLSYWKTSKNDINKQFVKSTTELNTSDFERYLEECRIFIWHEFQIKVPLPNELTEEVLMQFKNTYDY